MTRGVDFELLADYVGGALEGTEKLAIAELIATVPSWTLAYRELVAATDAVQRQLSSLPMAPMPADVAARLDAAFAAEARTPSLAHRQGNDLPTDRDNDRPADRRPPPTAAKSTRSDSARPARKQRSRRLLPALGALVAVLFVVVVGGKYLTTVGPSADSKAGTNAGRYEDNSTGGSIGAPQAAQGGSGFNYTPTSLPAIGAVAPEIDHDRSPSAIAPTPNPLSVDGTVPKALGTMSQPGPQRSSCLAAIQAAVPVPPGQLASLYDLAYFQGQPAIIVVYLDGAIVRRVVVAGANCGSGTADLLYQSPPQ